MLWILGYIKNRDMHKLVSSFAKDFDNRYAEESNYDNWRDLVLDHLEDWVRDNLHNGYLYGVLARTGLDPFLDAIRNSDDPDLPRNGEQFFYWALESLIRDCVKWEEDEDKDDSVYESRRPRRGRSLTESRRLSPLRRRNQGIRR